MRDVNVRQKLKSFIKYDLVSDDDKVFRLIRPPTSNLSYNNIKDNPELINKWLRLVRDQLYDEEAIKAFDHLLIINAYVLQYHKKAPVFFFKFGITGNSGENYIDNSFKNLYGSFSQLGITEQHFNEKQNGGLAKKLYRSYDEFSSDNYQNKATNNIIKHLRSLLTQKVLYVLIKVTMFSFPNRLYYIIAFQHLSDHDLFLCDLTHQCTSSRTCGSYVNNLLAAMRLPSPLSVLCAPPPQPGCSSTRLAPTETTAPPAPALPMLR